MNVLFVHNNFPGQFQYIARALARDLKNKIVAIGSSTSRKIAGIHVVRYDLQHIDVSSAHPFARRFDIECHRAEQVLYALTSLASSGFIPDVILAHPGWGETLPLRTVFPRAKLIIYCEFFYHANGRDVGFDSEFPPNGLDGNVGLHLKNASSLLALADCDGAISPTEWQRSTFPAEFQEKITILHEGVDTDRLTPNPGATLRLNSTQELRSSDEVVTFVCRNLEPLRGYHIFMRALPRIMAERPHSQIVIIGGDRVSYGAPAPDGSTWKTLFLNEVADRIDLSRVHFLGRLPYSEYIRALQISSAHVYLTYPFVLSWSLLEAMSAGCVVIASDTAPVREAVNNKCGILVPFFDFDGLAKKAIEVLASPRRFSSLRLAARDTITDRYDLSRQCLPKMIAFVEQAAASATSVRRQVRAPLSVGSQHIRARPAL